MKICSRCKIQKSNENFLNAKGKPLLTCMNCRTRTPVKQQQQQTESESESESEHMNTPEASESKSSDYEDDEEPFHVVCSFCNTEYHDYDSTEKHVNSKKHKQNMKQQ